MAAPPFGVNGGGIFGQYGGVMASSLGKMPTTSVRRLISPITRSSGLVEDLIDHNELRHDPVLAVLAGIGEFKTAFAFGAPVRLPSVRTAG